MGMGPGGFRRGRKARRGDVRTAALLLLAEEPRNGYQIMQEIEERSGGVWSPSPGVGLPGAAAARGRGAGALRARSTAASCCDLTDAGRKLVAERGEDQPAPWEEMARDVGDDARAIMKSCARSWCAVAQVIQTGSDAQLEEARRLLIGLRRDLYRMLAEGGDAETGQSGGAGEGA